MRTIPAPKGRKRRESTLPGPGFSAKEQMRRATPLKHLIAVINEEAHASGDPLDQYSLYMFQPSDASPDKARCLLESLPTPVLITLARDLRISRKCTLASILGNICGSGSDRKEWAAVIGNQRAKDFLLDAASYRHAYRRSNPDPSSDFSDLYPLVPYAPGQLHLLAGRERSGIEALLRLLSESRRLYGLLRWETPEAYPEPRYGMSIPAPVVEYVLARPDRADAILAYLKERKLDIERLDIEDIRGLLDDAPVLLEGAL